MYFEKLKILGFGCLRTEVEFKSDKLNLAIAENESGKSTLISALLASFYGIVEDERRTRDKRPHRAAFIPWTKPEEFGLILDFSTDSRKWRIERDFFNGNIKLEDRETGKDHTADFHRGKGVYTIGEDLIGLSCDDFLKSFYLKQEEFLEARDSKSLTRYVQQVATAREGENTSENAIERLRNTLARYPYEGSKSGLTIDNALKRINAEIDDVQGRIDGLTREREQIEPESERLANVESDIKRLQADRKLQEKIGDLAEIRELTAQVESQERIHEEIGQLRKEAEELEKLKTFPASESERLNRISGEIDRIKSLLEERRNKLKDEVIASLQEYEEELITYGDLSDLNDRDLKDFEAAFSRLNDRRDRFKTARREMDKYERELMGHGFDRDRFKRLKNAFGGLYESELKFIDRFRESYNEAEARYKEAKLRREVKEREKEAVLKRRGRVFATARMFWITAAVLVIAGGLMMSLTQAGWLGQMLAGTGVIAGAVGTIIRGVAGGLDNKSLREINNRLEEAREAEKHTNGLLDKVTANLELIMKKLEFPDCDTLLEDFGWYDNQRRSAGNYMDAEREVKRAVARAEEAFTALTPFFQKDRRELPKGENAMADARELLQKFRAIAPIKREWEKANLEKERLNEEIKKLEEDYDSNYKEYRGILKKTSIKSFEDLDSTLSEFAGMKSKYDRYKEITEVRLPGLEREALPEEDLVAKKKRIKALADKGVRDDPEVEIDHTREYYRDNVENAGAEIEHKQRELQDIYRKIGSVLDRFEKDFPELQRRLEDASELKRRAETFQSEIETAVNIMTDISRDVYKTWANALSEESAPFIAALNPRYSDLRFNEDLTFTIRDHGAGRVFASSEVESLLSTGARDEIFLSARLGISSYISRGANGSIPMVMDEPLAAADDEKFLSGMRFFLEELSTSHQVLIMSCHAERHRWLAQMMQEIFSERVHGISIVNGN